MTSTDLIKRAIESAECRLYKVRARDSYSFEHQQKAENQTEIMEITIEALEKQIPKKVANLEKDCDTYGKCPKCKEMFWITEGDEFDYCPTCGQALDWSEEE